MTDLRHRQVLPRATGSGPAGGQPIAVRLRHLVYLVVALPLLVSVMAVGVLQLQSNQSDLLSRAIAPAFDANGQVLQTMTDAQTGLRGYQISRDRELLAPYLDARARTTAMLATLQDKLELVTLGKDAGAVFASLQARQQLAVEQWWVYALSAEQTVASGGGTDLSRGRALFDDFRLSNAALGEHIQTERARARSVARTISAAGTAATIAVTLAALLVAFVLGRRAARSISAPLTDLRDTVTRQREGEPGARAREGWGSLELRSLAADFNALTERNLGLQEIQAGDLRMNKLTFDIARAIRAAQGTQQALDAVCAALGQGLGVDRVVANTFDTHHNMLLGAEWHVPDLRPLGKIPGDMLPQVGQLAEGLWLSSERLTLDDLLAPELGSRESAEFFNRKTGARALMVIPIGLGDRAMGMIYVVSVDHPRRWTQSEGRAVQQVAGFVGRAIVEDDLRAHQSEYVERLEVLDRHKTDFLATVSHELRTPLTSISGYLELLRDGDAGALTPEQQRMLEVINRNTSRLRGLIEDLLVLNRIESGGLMTNLAGVSMRALIRDATQELSPLAQSGDIEIDIDAGPKAAIVQGDRGQLHRAVVNIVSNAIKFSHRGGVIAIRCAVDHAAGRVLVTCQDRGIGIPAGDQAQLFTRFYRASNAADQAIPGTGLGLSIVKQIVEDHGGELRLTSAEGEGTLVVMDLPLSEMPLAVRVPAPADEGMIPA